MVRAVKRRMFGFQNSDLKFIALFAVDDKSVKTIVSSAFYELYQSTSIQGRKNLAQIYLRMIRCGYYQVNRNRIDLPFVTCDTKEQIDNLHSVLAYIMTQYDMYCQLRWILQAYLEEISDYDVPSGILNHVTAFFYVLTKGEIDDQRDILLFLSELKGDIAKKIYDKLIKIYKNSGGIRK